MTRAVFGGLLYVIDTCLKDGSAVTSYNILMSLASYLRPSAVSYLVSTHSLEMITEPLYSVFISPVLSTAAATGCPGGCNRSMS